MFNGRRWLLCAGLTIGLLGGCASGRNTWTLTGSPRVPAAQGTVKTQRGDNDNTRIRVTVEHLAPPDRVASGAAAFVVWARPMAQQGTPQNLGALQVSSDLKGSLDTVTPLRAFELLITPEPMAMAQLPTNEPILSVRVRRE